MLTTDTKWPTGIVTFLFTDIVDSTPLWDHHRSAMQPAQAEHDTLLKSAVESNGGVIVKTTGDGAMAAFSSPFSALNAALDAQHAIHVATWSAINPDRINVRMGLHTGEAELRAGDYYGTEVNRAARVMSIGHGGQILVSGTAARLLEGSLPNDISLSDLGEHWLKGLERPAQIFQVVAPFLPRDFPLLRTGEVGKDNLPQPLSSFVGREMELKQLDEFFADPSTRLVTILGPGGMGKTQLSIKWARGETGHNGKAPYTDGIHFVDLAPLNSPDQVAPAIAEVLAFPLQTERRSPEQQILDYLREKNMLLILDNFEHVTGASAFVHEILRTAPAVQLLVTSRQRLHLRAEQIFAIEGLTYPPSPLPDDIDLEAYAAVQLFIRCVRRIHPGYEVAGEAREPVARICRITAGMPLAIELAAAWLDLMPIVTIADEVEQRLDILETDLTDIPKRHRSIRAAINTSWEYLNPEQRQTFTWLSIFRGGFTWEAATAVLRYEGGEMVLRRALHRLRDKSLLGYDVAAERFVMHELLRQYGADKMRAGVYSADINMVQERHALFYTGLLSDCASGLKGPHFSDSLQLIESDLENILSAWEWLAEYDRRKELAAAMDSLGLFYEISGYFTTARRIFKALVVRWRERLAGTVIDSTDIAQDRLFLSKIIAWQSAFENSGEEAESLLYEALAILKDSRIEDNQDSVTRAFIFLRLGITLQDSNKTLAAAYMEKGLKIYQEVDDLWGAGSCLYYLGITMMYIDLVSGHRYLLQASDIFEENSNVRGLVKTLSKLVIVAALKGDEKTLDRAFNRYMELVAGLEQEVFVADTLSVQELNSFAKGRFGQSARFLEKLINYHKELGRDTTQEEAYLANAYMHMGQSDKAQGILQRSRQKLEESSVENDWRLAWNLHATAILALTEDEPQKAHNELQRALNIYRDNEDLDNLAGAQALSAIALISMGDQETPRLDLIDILKHSLEQGAIIPLAEVFLGFALLLAYQGEQVRARELYEIIFRNPRFGDSAVYESIAGRKIRALTSDLATEDLRAVEERAAKTNIWQEATLLLDELQTDG